MTTLNDQAIIEMIRKSPILMEPEKNYLIDKVLVMGPLDKLKTKKALTTNTTPDLVLEFRKTAHVFIDKEQEEQKKSEQLANKSMFGKSNEPRIIVAHSLLSQPTLLGGPTPAPAPSAPIRITSLDDIKEPYQLNSLIPEIVSYGINENGEQSIRNFLEKMEIKITAIPDISIKRNMFALFLQSPLFRVYINTGITALKHPEIKPKNTVLNTMQKIDGRFMNRSQFELTTLISSGLRAMMGL
jgi:hypothetical protein